MGPAAVEVLLVDMVIMDEAVGSVGDTGGSIKSVMVFFALAAGLDFLMSVGERRNW